MELNNKFTKKTIELLTFSDALNPINGFKLFSTYSICILAEKLHSQNFTKNDMTIR